MMIMRLQWQKSISNNYLSLCILTNTYDTLFLDVYYLFSPLEKNTTKVRKLVNERID